MRVCEVWSIPPSGPLPRPGTSPARNWRLRSPGVELGRRGAGGKAWMGGGARIGPEKEQKQDYEQEQGKGHG